MGGFSVYLHLTLTIGEGGYISIQERDGGFTVHGCGALYCELDVRIDCIKMAMEIVKLCRLYTRVWIVNISEPPAGGSRECWQSLNLDVFHYQVGDDYAHGWAHSAAENLVIQSPFIWKEAVVQYDFRQLYNLILGQFCLVFPGVIRIQLALDDF